MPQSSGLTPAAQEAQKRIEERDAEIAKRDAAVSSTSQERDAVVAKRDDEVTIPTNTQERDEVIKARDQELANRDAMITSQTPNTAPTHEEQMASEVAKRDAAVAARPPPQAATVPAGVASPDHYEDPDFIRGADPSGRSENITAVPSPNP
jgi:hypothetical protein